ncbi:MAG TPA: hypothetical protein VH437_08080 [Terriglobales bacterium]|jgi:hypothetical protein
MRTLTKHAVVALTGLLFSQYTFAADAAQAAKVVVTNSAVRPALTSRIDDPGRIPYQSTQKLTCTTVNCTFTFGAIPEGHRLVIQHVSGKFLFSGGGLQAIVTLTAGGADESDFTAALNSNVPEATFDQSVQFYVDAGQAPVVNGFLPLGKFTDGQTVTLMGYELDCVSAPCAPIAH